MIPVGAQGVACIWPEGAEGRGREVVVAGPLVTQGLINQDNVGRVTKRDDLAGRGDADEELTAGCEELLCYQYRKGCSDDPTEYAALDAIEPEGGKCCVADGSATLPRRQSPRWRD